MSEVVIFETLSLNGENAQGQKLARVTLNVESTLNSLSLEMIELLYDKLFAWREDDSIVAVFFQGAGDRAFCAGGDIQALYHSMVDHPDGPNPYADVFFEKEYRLDYLIHTYPKPTIVWAHGIVMGGGLGIMGACDYRIGTERTRIAMPEISIGLFPDAGATWLFSQMEKSFAHFIALTGCSLNGKDALKVNLVNHLAAHEKKEGVVVALLKSDWSLSSKEIIDTIIADLAEDEISFPASKLEEHEGLIDTLMASCFASVNFIESFSVAVADLKDDSWLEKSAQAFRAGAPTTAQIIERQFKEAEGKTLKEMFMTELVIAVQCARHREFMEGVRALLIEKDNNPNWQHKTMGQVPTSWIDEHFTAPWEKNPLNSL